MSRGRPLHASCPFSAGQWSGKGDPLDLRTVDLGKVDTLKIQELDEPGGRANTSSVVGHFTFDREAKG
jgi:hypothetical protein